MPPTPAPPAASVRRLEDSRSFCRHLSAEPAPPPAAQPPIAQAPAGTADAAGVFVTPSSSRRPRRVYASYFGIGVARPATGRVLRRSPPVAAAPARAGLPPIQMPPAPAFPQHAAMPQMPHAGAAAPPAMPQFQPAPFAFPPAPAPPPPAPGSGTRQAATIPAADPDFECLRVAGDRADFDFRLAAQVAGLYSGLANRMISSISGFGISPGT